MSNALTKLPKKPKNRFEVYRVFNGLSAEGKEGLERGRMRVPLVKTFLLEHVSSRNGAKVRPLTEIWRDLHTEPTQIDESFFSVEDLVKESETAVPMRTITGYLERYDERFFAYYTTEDSLNARKRVTKWATRSPDLDFAWFTSPLLKALWDRDVSLRGDLRFGKLVFRHESVFELPEDAVDAVEDEEATALAEEPETDESPELERRKFRSEMGDCIGRIRKSLDALQDSYSPLNALFSVRIPSHLGRGGHELFQHGQVTNRADNFEDHRNTARYLYRIYKSVLETTEDHAWGEPQANQGKVVGWGGVPLIVTFLDEPLSKPTFDFWISRAFRKNGLFKLWGEPLRLGPTKVHVYGADRHLWQPINMELTERGVVAILPHGTCGNTFHRLVTNIQRYVCPKIDAWLGSKRFEAFLDKMDLKAANNES
ncbi:MAG: hypothetical protein HY298_09860 [Verrucomicrobia bacterium]|nr:hypothetical protein [Verrucomicrobiota bacterium]